MTTHRINGLVIVTGFDYPPIPIRSYDWHAVLDNYDGAPDAGWRPVGHGRTEDEAIADLLCEIEDHDAAYEREEAADIAREEKRDAVAERYLDDEPFHE